MKKGAVIFVLGFVFILSVFLSAYLVSSQSIDSSIRKMTNYAEEYETGSMKYAELIVRLASSSKELTKVMGATSQEHDLVLTQEQLEKALGAPTETTNWVWVEGEDREKKSDGKLPAWRKIIFDGNGIQIFLSAWPSIRTFNNEERTIYRINPEISFKNEEEKIDIESEIEGIKKLAEEYSLNPTRENLENLAEQSASVEQTFNNNKYKNSAKCEETFNELFGSENKRGTQNINLWEIDFFEGDNFEANMRLELCDNCDWKWVNLYGRVETRGRFQQLEENRDYDGNFRDRYSGFTKEDFERETEEIILRVRTELENRNLQSAMDKMQELRELTNMWNEYANDVWKELDEKYNVDFRKMTKEESEVCSKNYCWIKAEQERRKAEIDLREKNYQERKQFYTELFAEDDKKETYSLQKQWEQRVVEAFKESGEEICDNNVDDNNNEQVDCSEAQCGGKVCGYDTVTIEDKNGVKTEQKRELYCIEGACQPKEEIVKVIACGNNICEENEQETCASDCAICVQHEALACDGTAIFSGQDANSCPLAPLCLTEVVSCEADDDCVDPLCGDSSCVEGTCQLLQLTECREAECVDGEERNQNCASGEIIVADKCIEGIWRATGVECQIAQEETTETEAGETPETEVETEEIAEEIVGNACSVRSDCGNENDVCSNGRCVTLPETIEETPRIDEITEGIDEQEEREEDEEEGVVDEEITDEESGSQITGNVVFSFFRNLINGFQTLGEGGGEGGSSGGGDNGGEGSSSGEGGGEGGGENGGGDGGGENSGQENQGNNDKEREDREDREREEQERRKQECGQRCDSQCYDQERRPCVEKYIREKCGEKFECNIDEARVEGEESCKSTSEFESCVSECSGKCLAGENTWVEPEKEEHKEERFVFTAGGACKKERDRLDESIWFGGWGEEEFKDFHLIKEKYYSHGGTDWCEREYKNLVKQRQELEESLDEEFASWFFEKYVANAAEDWENHMSGIFEIYWRNVDLSRQLAERAQCLGKEELPPHNLINLKYETEYGSIELWEEIKGGKISEDGDEVQLISPYMKTWLFPSREFFKLEMKKAMESNRLPGPAGGESRNTLSEEQKQDLVDDGILDDIKKFNNEFGDDLVIQFKDFNTGEVVFNIYVRINEEEIMYFKPMLYSEVPAEDVKVELDIDKLLAIVEYEERDRVRLESPPWDKKSEFGLVEKVVDSVEMYFMFKDLLNSAVVSPPSAESDAKHFTRRFFEFAMGDGDKEGGEMEGEGFDDEEKVEQRDLVTGEVIGYY